MSKTSLVDKIAEKISNSGLGEIISESDIADIVREAIPKVFFEPRQTKEGYSTFTREPLIIEILRGFLEPMAKSAVEKWVRDNQEMMVSYWVKVMDAGLVDYIQKRQKIEASVALESVLGKWLVIINEERAREGRSPISAPFLSHY